MEEFRLTAKMHDAAVRQKGDRLLLYLVHQSITAVLGWLGKVLLVHPMLAAGTAPHSSLTGIKIDDSRFLNHNQWRTLIKMHPVINEGEIFEIDFSNRGL